MEEIPDFLNCTGTIRHSYAEKKRICTVILQKLTQNSHRLNVKCKIRKILE